MRTIPRYAFARAIPAVPAITLTSAPRGAWPAWSVVKGVVGKGEGEGTSIYGDCERRVVAQTQEDEMTRVSSTIGARCKGLADKGSSLELHSLRQDTFMRGRRRGGGSRPRAAVEDERFSDGRVDVPGYARFRASTRTTQLDTPRRLCQNARAKSRRKIPKTRASLVLPCVAENGSYPGSRKRPSENTTNGRSLPLLALLDG